MHLAHDYNELLIKDGNFDIEARLQKEKNTLTVEAKPDEQIEQRCSALFAILNGSDIFNRLADKEILIEIVSLIWASSHADRESGQQGILITMKTTPLASKIKIFQSQHNRVMVEAGGERQKAQISLLAEFAHNQNTQRILLKLISLFFSYEIDGIDAGNWRFSCFEAANQITANAIGPQRLNIDLRIKDNCFSAIFISTAADSHLIDDRSRQILQKGAEELEISDNCRQIELISNAQKLPKEQTRHIIRQTREIVQQELDELRQDKIRKEVEDEKALEAAQRSARLQSIYDEALRVYNFQHGFDENDEAERDTAPTLEEAVQVRVKKNLAKEEFQRIYRRVLIGAASLLLLMALFVAYLFTATGKPPSSSGLFLASQSPVAPAPSPPAPAAKPQLVRQRDPASELIHYACATINQQRPPGQKTLNELLRRLYLSDDKMKQGGDIYNIMARLFWYKIHLGEREKLYRPEWLKKWRAQAQRMFALAEAKYRDQQFASGISISLDYWKPERRYCNEKQKLIQYSDPKQALTDVRAMQDKLR